MKKNKQIKILQQKDEFYDIQYSWALDLVDLQNSTFWQFDETDPYKDLHCIKTQMSEAEIHGITEVLKLFTVYETKIGEDYWNNVVSKVFGHPEIKMLATTNAYYEVVHARFYNEINKVMGLDTKEFYTQYKLDPVLSERIKFIGKACLIPKDYNALDVLKSISTFMFIEGVILSSNFAFIKHFSCNGKNLLTNLIAGINYSLRDETQIHVVAGELLYKALLKEAELTDEEYNNLKQHIIKISEKTLEHETKIIEMIFSKGRIEGITGHQMEIFVQSRINIILEQLQLTNIYDIKYNPISDWYYNNISSTKLVDFFAKQSADYSRHWDKSKFTY